MDDWNAKLEVRKVSKQYGVYEQSSTDDSPLCMFDDKVNAELAHSHLATNMDLLVQTKLQNRLINAVYDLADQLVTEWRTR